MHAAHQPQPTPLNIAPVQSQAPAIHLTSMQGLTGQAGQGWPVSGLLQPSSHGSQAQSGPVVSRDGVQPTAVLPSHKWALNPAGSTQMPNQVPTQQGNAMVYNLCPRSRRCMVNQVHFTCLLNCLRHSARPKQPPILCGRTNHR